MSDKEQIEQDRNLYGTCAVAIRHGLGIRVMLKDGRTAVLHPHTMAYDERGGQGFYIVEGRELYWLDDIARAWLYYMELTQND
jgi:hypothetical protein